MQTGPIPEIEWPAAVVIEWPAAGIAPSRCHLPSPQPASADELTGDDLAVVGLCLLGCLPLVLVGLAWRFG